MSLLDTYVLSVSVFVCEWFENALWLWLTNRSCTFPTVAKTELFPNKFIWGISIEKSIWNAYRVLSNPVQSSSRKSMSMQIKCAFNNQIVTIIWNMHKAARRYSFTTHRETTHSILKAGDNNQRKTSLIITFYVKTTK